MNCKQALDQIPYKSDEIIHIGDEFTSDCASANAHQIKNIHYAQSFRWQTEIEDLESKVRLGVERIDNQGAWCHIRRKVANAFSRSTCTTTYEAYGAFIYGPIFYGFGVWCIQKAKELGINKIFCFTRESHLLVPLLKMIAKDDASIEILPLTISRQFAKLITINKISVPSLLNLFSPKRQYSGADFLNILGLSCENNLYIDIDDQILSKDQISKLLTSLLSNKKYAEEITLFINQQKNEYEAYLKSIGFIDEQNSTICDLGWSGTTQRLLREFLAQKNIRLNMTGSYLATRKEALKILSDTDSLYGYLIHYGHADACTESFFNSNTMKAELIDLVTMPKHGSFKLFDQGTPIFSQSLLKSSQLNQIQDIQHGILSFARIAKLYLNDNKTTSIRSLHRDEFYSKGKEIALNIILRASLSLTTIEVDLIKKWHLEPGLGSSELRKLFPDNILNRDSVS